MVSHRIRQRSSHRGLLDDISAAPAGGGRARMDAVVVPSIRSAAALGFAVRLAAEAGARLVVLGSHDTRLADVSALVAGTPGSRALVVDVPDGYEHDLLHFATSADERFHRAGAGRSSNLSTKRNLGLLLARLLGWHKVFFVDDDLDRFGPPQVSQLARQLDRHGTAGMVSRHFPDNSVVCHANRLGGGDQDVFITGAALGVNCRDRVPGFFPDIYNEDWFFLVHDLLARPIPKVGEARQREYDPYDDPQRAAHEEFGDVLAEGLFALIESGDPLEGATRRYWGTFLDARDEFHVTVIDRLHQLGGNLAYRAIESVERARAQLERLTAELCVDYLQAWQDDLTKWRYRLRGLPCLGTPYEAMEHLGLKNWCDVEFASPGVRGPSAQEPSSPTTATTKRDSRRPVPART